MEIKFLKVHNDEKNKNYKITKIEKENIWANLNLSGSKFKEWCLRPDIFIKNEKKEFPDFMKEKIEFGNKIEGFIFDTTKEKNKNYEFIKDKNTYQHEIYNFCFANIDGFYLNSKKEKGILEIKNTETNNIEKLIDTYKYQVLYYSWFFGLKNVMFAFLINGCRFRIAEFSFDDEDIKWCENRIIEFKKFLDNGEIPKVNKLIIENNDKNELEQILKDYDDKINVFQELKNEIENLEKTIKEHCEKTQEKLESSKYIFNLTYTQRTALDRSKVQEYADKNKIDFSIFEKTTQLNILRKTKKD